MKTSSYAIDPIKIYMTELLHEYSSNKFTFTEKKDTVFS